MTDRRQVLRLITRLNVGGPGRQALLLTRELAAEFPTTLAAGVPSAAEGELTDPLVPVTWVPLIRPVHAPTDARATAAVRRLLAETRPKVVHTHMAKAGAIGRSAALTVGSRPRTVHTFHGHVLDGYFGATSRRMFIELERYLARHTDVLVAVSPEIRDELLALDIGRPGQYRVIPLGLDLSRFLAVEQPDGRLRLKLGLDCGVPLVGVVGRLVPIKDNHTLLAAVARLPGVHLAVIGDGEVRPALEAAARELGIAARVHFTGWWDDVAGAMSDLDVVALTSRNEGTPVALIEAAACARSVVATRVGGVPHVVVEGVTGLMARPGDVDHVAERLALLLRSPALRAEMGAAARERVRTRFGHERLVHDVRELYTDLCSSPAPGRRRQPVGSPIFGQRPART